MDILKAMIPIVVVPLVLIVVVSVLTSTEDTSKFSFEVAKVAEDTGTDAAGEEVEASSLSHCKINSVTAAYNGSTLMTASTDYNMSYAANGFGVCTATVGAHVEAGDIKLTYTAYDGDGYTAFTKMNDNSYKGINLATLLPYVIAAMLVLGIVIMAVKV